MNGELERLKADLEVLDRYHGYSILENARADLADKVAQMEADEADPWREVKRFVEIARQCNAGLRTTWEQSRRLAEYIDHLTAENARLTARVAELEAEAKAEDDEDLGDAEEALANLKAFVSEFPPRREEDKSCRSIADMQPPFEGLIESIEPILDPARVLATAIEVLKTIDEPDMFYASNLAKAYQCLFRHSSKAKPYPLKGGEE